MNRRQLEHLIRAASTIAEDDELIIVGSQAILGTHPDAPAELLVSEEADLYPKNLPERADLIDGSIGELSPFHQTFGYYAQGVAEGTATLPDGWQARLVAIKTPATRGATGWCISVPDLVVSKYVAGREKDRDYVRAALAHGLVDASVILALLALTPLDAKHRALLEMIVRADAKGVAPRS
jgi:hypothetical protein